MSSILATRAPQRHGVAGIGWLVYRRTPDLRNTAWWIKKLALCPKNRKAAGHKTDGFAFTLRALGRFCAYCGGVKHLENGDDYMVFGQHRYR